MPSRSGIHFSQHALHKQIVMTSKNAFCITVSLFPVSAAQRHIEAPKGIYLYLWVVSLWDEHAVRLLYA